MGPFEAIASGVPVISTNVGMLKSYKSIPKFTSVVEAIQVIHGLNSNKSWKILWENQYAEFSDLFCMEKMLPKWLEFFEAAKIK